MSLLQNLEKSVASIGVAADVPVGPGVAADVPVGPCVARYAKRPRREHDARAGSFVVHALACPSSAVPDDPDTLKRGQQTRIPNQRGGRKATLGVRNHTSIDGDIGCYTSIDGDVGYYTRTDGDVGYYTRGYRTSDSPPSRSFCRRLL